MKKSELEKHFYRLVPKARKINPFFREYFELMYDAYTSLDNNSSVLNIFSSSDLSSKREEAFKDIFFSKASYSAIDFWEDSFIASDGYSKTSKPHNIDYPSNSFNVIVTTKVILEHISDPQTVIDEIYRVLKPGGKAFIIAPHIRRQHQAPFDFFRYTEYALNRIFRNAGFKNIILTHTGGFMCVIGYYFYFFQRGIGAPPLIERVLDIAHYWIIEPFFYWLDQFDNGYGRDMTLYFMIRVQK